MPEPKMHCSQCNGYKLGSEITTLEPLCYCRFHLCKDCTEMFRQTDVVFDDNGVTDMVIWNLLNYTDSFEKAVQKVKDGKSRFQDADEYLY